MNATELSRRSFMRRCADLALAGTAAPLALNLAALGEAAAAGATDYKALVCIFLYGGNDHANTVVPLDSARHERYRSIRGGLAVPRDALAATALQPTQPRADGAQFALHPAMGSLASMFNAGQAAVLFNVGPLIVPLTKAQLYSGNVARYPVPPKLYSHNDQASIWQASDPEGATRGWGGRLGDLALASNGGSLFTCISATGSGVFVSGDQSLRYQVSTAGAVPIRMLNSGPYGAQGMAATVRELLTEARGHVLEHEYNRVTARSIGAQTQVTSALAGAQLVTAFPGGNSLANELAIVARLIAARQALGVRRQVFLCSLGGFDNHDNLLSVHPALLGKVSEALAAFQRATVELGLSEQVTAFTASDFGRALSSNGDGTDHGWGGHHFIVGGAVRGRAFYGTPPPPSVGETTAPDDQWQVGNGRLLPTTSVAQLAATLGRWFGAGDSDLNSVLPNLRSFGISQAGIDYPLDLGFMR